MTHTTLQKISPAQAELFKSMGMRVPAGLVVDPRMGPKSKKKVGKGIPGKGQTQAQAKKIGKPSVKTTSGRAPAKGTSNFKADNNLTRYGKAVRSETQVKNLKKGFYVMTPDGIFRHMSDRNAENNTVALVYRNTGKDPFAKSWK